MTAELSIPFSRKPSTLVPTSGNTNIRENFSFSNCTSKDCAEISSEWSAEESGGVTTELKVFGGYIQGVR